MIAVTIPLDSVTGAADGIRKGRILTYMPQVMMIA